MFVDPLPNPPSSVALSLGTRGQPHRGNVCATASNFFWNRHGLEGYRPVCSASSPDFFVIQMHHAPKYGPLHPLASVTLGPHANACTFCHCGVREVRSEVGFSLRCTGQGSRVDELNLSGCNRGFNDNEGVKRFPLLILFLGAGLALAQKVRMDFLVDFSSPNRSRPHP